MPFFSIIIPTYNRAHLITRTIQSLISQTFEDWELLVVDDGSTDKTKDIILENKDSRVKYIYQDNAERSAARNRGIQEACGKWICFLDSDDEYLPQHLSSFHQKIQENAEPRLLATNISKQSSKGIVNRILIENEATNMLHEIWTKFIIPTQVCIHHSILEAHQFDSRFRLWEDTHLFLRIASEYPIQAIDEITSIQHIHDGSTVEQGLAKVKIKDVEQYIIAVSDLSNYPQVMNILTDSDIKNYIDSKYRMYLYQARKNKQIKIAFRIWYKAILNRPSFYLLSEVFKLSLNMIGIG